MIGANVPKFTDAELVAGMEERIASCVADKAVNVQMLKDIQLCVKIMDNKPAIYNSELRASVETLLAERTAQVKDRYEKNGWAFNF